MKQIKVSDKVYEEVKALAGAEFRSIGGQVEFLLYAYKTSVKSEKFKNKPVNKPVKQLVDKKSPAQLRSEIISLESERLSLETDRVSALEYCQDEEEVKRIHSEYQKEIDSLEKEIDSLQREV